MDILFQMVLKISVFTSVIIFFLSVLSHFLGKRYGVKWRYFVWLIIALRLVLPFYFTLPQPVVKIPMPQVAIQSMEKSKSFSSEGDYLSYQPVAISTVVQKEMNQHSGMDGFFTNLQDIWERIWIFWLLGMVAYFAYQGKKYSNFLKNLNRNSRCIRDAEVLEIYYDVCREMGMEKRPEIFFCGILPSPLCIGLYRQKIYLNYENYKVEQLRFILKHELVHCNRRDIWYKALLMIAKGIHFFNPFVHWMVRLAERDLEYFCDSLVLAGCSLSQRQDYGLTILQSIRQGQKANSLSTAFHGGKEMLKVRIDHIFDMGKKKRGIPSLLALVLIICMGTAFVGCSAKEEIAQNTEVSIDIIKTLYQCKLDYIGNHIGVGKILGNLNLPKGLSPSQEGIELFTKEGPYGARQYLTLDKGVEIPENGWFEKNAMIFLALVENASYFEYAITDQTDEEKILYFDRENGENYFGNTDLRSMAVDEGAFRSFMQELNALFPETGDGELSEKEKESF